SGTSSAAGPPNPAGPARSSSPLELRAHLIGVLSEPGWRLPGRRDAAVDADRLGDQPERSALGVVDGLDRGRALGRREDLVERSDRRAGDRGLLERREPLDR